MRVLLNWYETSSHVVRYEGSANSELEKMPKSIGLHVIIRVLWLGKLRKTNAGNAEHKGNRKCLSVRTLHVEISVLNIGGIGTG